MAIVQFRVDDDLKRQFVEIVELLGLDLSSALKMYMKRVTMDKGIALNMYLTKYDLLSKEEKEKLHKDYEDASKEMWRISKENGNDKLTMEEIDEIIKEVRLERRNKK